MMEEYWGDFYTPPSPPAGATPKGQSQSAPAAKPVTPEDDVKMQLRNSITITAPTPVFKKR